GPRQPSGDEQGAAASAMSAGVDTPCPAGPGQPSGDEQRPPGSATPAWVDRPGPAGPGQLPGDERGAAASATPAGVGRVGSGAADLGQAAQPLPGRSVSSPSGQCAGEPAKPPADGSAEPVPAETVPAEAGVAGLAAAGAAGPGSVPVPAPEREVQRIRVD